MMVQQVKPGVKMAQKSLESLNLKIGHGPKRLFNVRLYGSVLGELYELAEASEVRATNVVRSIINDALDAHRIPGAPSVSIREKNTEEAPAGAIGGDGRGGTTTNQQEAV